MNYSPAPWVIADDGTIEARHQGRVGQLKDAGQADTAVIQAAPELLAALDALHLAVTMRPSGWSPGLSLAERAALDKARALLARVKSA